MGIEQFFSTITDKENEIINQKPFLKQIIKGKKVLATYLLIDFISILHMTQGEVLANLNKVLANLILEVYGDNISVSICKKYKLDINKTIKAEEFVKMLNQNAIEEMIINQMEEYLKNLIGNIVSNDLLKVIYIAIDGVASKAKMQESRNRRYLTYVLEELKKKIFEKHEKDIKKQTARYKFETLKFKWDRKALSVKTPFMDKVTSRLQSKEWNLFLKKTCPKLKNYILSTYDEDCEGEFKLMAYIRKEKLSQDDRICIYGPDSDSVLLAMLLETNIGKYKSIKNISMITEQSKKMSSLLEVDTFISNLYDYVKKKSKYDCDYSNLTRDLVYLFTFFGNDFVPRIESMHIKTDFSTLINKYINIFDGKYIIEDKNNRAIINHDVFIKLLESLAIDEEKMLYNKYIYVTSMNYKRMAEEFGGEDVYEKINEFLNNIKDIVKKIKKDKDFKIEFDLYNHYIQLDTNDYPILNEEDFKQKLKKYVKKYDKIDITKLRLMPFSTRTDNQMHKKKIDSSVKDINSNFKVLEYDIEIYALDNMLDQYSKKFGNEKTVIGEINFDYDNYEIIRDDYKEMNKEYYKKVLKKKTKEKFIRAYIKGLLWVFEYYYNSYDRNSVDLWYYKFKKTPLLRDIVDYYKKNIEKINKMQEKVIYKQWNPKYKFKPIEQLIYISVNLDGLGFNQKIMKIIDELKKIGAYQDLNKIVEEIWTKDKSDYLNCQGCIFVNKCHIKKIKLKIKDEELIKIIRNLLN